MFPKEAIYSIFNLGPNCDELSLGLRLRHVFCRNCLMCEGLQKSPRHERNWFRSAFFIQNYRSLNSNITIVASVLLR